MTLRERLGRELLFVDGAMGTMLQQAGLPSGVLPESWNIEHPEVIRGVHRAYLDAGCHILTANTFGAHALKLRGTPYTVADLVGGGVRLAREAIAESGRDDCYAAVDIGPSGKLLKPLGDLSFDDAYALFAEMAAAGEAAGADLVLIETMGDTYEVKAAVLAAKENTNLPVMVTVICDEQGKLLTGGDIPAVVALLEGLGVEALGVNCGLGPDRMLPLVRQLTACSSLPVIVNPNAGLPHSVDGRAVFDVDPAEFAARMKEITTAGAWVIGGCCGTTPAHIAAMIAACRDVAPPPVTPKSHTVVSSYSRAVTIGEHPILIGERINPTGKKRFKQALTENDMDYILREGVTQQENGAHILDVNVGLPGIDEPAMLTQVVTELQTVTDLPLQIDTSDGEAMERALRYYNGKAMVNSVNGKQESLHTVLPLVKKYGGVVVALTLDENGIPETAEGRLAIARHIVDTAATYGIPSKDIVVDTLTMTVSTGSDAARVTLDSLRLVKEALGVCTVLGVSNISFGLPQRDVINGAFYTAALHSGLDAAILNPASAGMQNAYHAFNALMGHDAQCAAYLARFSGEQPTATPAPAAEVDLYTAVVKGLKERAHAAAADRAATADSLTIINEELIPALNEVGEGFEQGRIFLPQLLMSAEAAKNAFDAIKAHLRSTGAQPVIREPIVLATVKGDIHDIGKNIVRVLLENYGYRVIDLGKDVEPQRIVDTVVAEDVRLVGLSALMTTTVPSMEATIRLLREAKPDCKIVVGGAVLTADYAAQIGADFYCKDAMATVHCAGRLFGYEE